MFGLKPPCTSFRWASIMLKDWKQTWWCFVKYNSASTMFKSLAAAAGTGSVTWQTHRLCWTFCQDWSLSLFNSVVELVISIKANKETQTGLLFNTHTNQLRESVVRTWPNTAGILKIKCALPDCSMEIIAALHMTQVLVQSHSEQRFPSKRDTEEKDLSRSPPLSPVWKRTTWAAQSHSLPPGADEFHCGRRGSESLSAWLCHKDSWTKAKLSPLMLPSTPWSGHWACWGTLRCC